MRFNCRYVFFVPHTERVLKRVLYMSRSPAHLQLPYPGLAYAFFTPHKERVLERILYMSSSRTRHSRQLSTSVGGPIRDRASLANNRLYPIFDRAAAGLKDFALRSYGQKGQLKRYLRKGTSSDAGKVL